MHFDTEIRKQHVLLESTKKELRAHLPHFEDLSIESGKEGFEEFVMHVGEILKRIEGLESEQHIGEKIDGSMSVYFGIDPRPTFKGQFSVATKSALSKEPKLIHSLDEIEALYPDKNETFKTHLAEVFTNLQKAYDYSGKIYMGDLLFSNGRQKRTTEINGVPHLYFKPNTLVYAVEEDPKSELYNRLNAASLGIFVHDSYTAESKEGKLSLTSAGKNIDGLIQKGKENGVFIEGSHIENVNLKVPKKSYNLIQRLLKKLSKEMEAVPAEFSEYWTSSPALDRMKKYINQQIHLPDGGIFGNSGRSFNAYKILEEFVPFIRGSYKNPKNAELVISTLKSKEESFIHLLKSFYWMLQIKNQLLDLFDQVESKIGKTFIQQEDGSFIPTRGEGFVFMHQGKYVKLVDRLSFTKNNKIFGRFNESLKVVLEFNWQKKLDGSYCWMDKNGKFYYFEQGEEHHGDAAIRILQNHFPEKYKTLPTDQPEDSAVYDALFDLGFVRIVSHDNKTYTAESPKPPTPAQKRSMINFCIEHEFQTIEWDSYAWTRRNSRIIWQRESAGHFNESAQIILENQQYRAAWVDPQGTLWKMTTHEEHQESATAHLNRLNPSRKQKPKEWDDYYTLIDLGWIRVTFDLADVNGIRVCYCNSNKIPNNKQQRILRDECIEADYDRLIWDPDIANPQNRIQREKILWERESSGVS